MYLADKIDELVTLLKKDETFAGVGIIKAFPFALKPTVLTKCVITVAPSSMSAENDSLGDREFFASYKIDADFFAPYILGSPAVENLVMRFLNKAADSSLCAVSVGAITANDTIRCYTVKCTLTYRGLFRFGDDENE